MQVLPTAPWEPAGRTARPRERSDPASVQTQGNADQERERALSRLKNTPHLPTSPPPHLFLNRYQMSSIVFTVKNWYCILPNEQKQYC
ncbi:hypothetical protein D5R40_33680 [Okeania hirsuta]|uniref:Uncharacterized protein n=1 Tax=Okeania hirsuta TaxID=1458930 RepID=A0A3N6PUX0_9CYAN|nr:hypothetical protein D5R40_33680 [Okeania hirsuta]RQH19913.1 hypothetical protein D4Z78_12615 [Okeania hirsuta]